MLLALDSIKALLGIPDADATYDASLTAAGEAITRQMEAYCARGLEFQSGAVEELLRFWDTRIYLRRFPIQALTSLNVDGGELDPADLFISEEWGWIERRDGQQFSGNIIVTADLGYPQDQVPADLALSFARACGVLSGFGAGATGSTAASSPIKSLGLGQGALTLGFDTARVAGGTSGAYDVGNVPVALQPMADVLQFYRRFYF